MSSKLAAIRGEFGARGTSANKRRKSRGRMKRPALESLEVRAMRDAAGICSELPATAAETYCAPTHLFAPPILSPLFLPQSPREPQAAAGDRAPLLGGDVFIWETPATGRLEDAAGAARPFVGVEVVRDVNLLSCLEGAEHCSTTLALRVAPPGKVFLGAFVEKIETRPAQGDSPAEHVYLRSEIYGVDGRLDVDGSAAVDGLDLFGLVTRLSSCLVQPASAMAPLPDACASDVDGDGATTYADLLPLIHHLRSQIELRQVGAFARAAFATHDSALVELADEPDWIFAESEEDRWEGPAPARLDGGDR
jgi:hypothetical protein